MGKELGNTYYNDLTPTEVYKNFLVKYPVFSYMRWFFMGFFGLIFKMSVRVNRGMRDPETGKVNPLFTYVLWFSIAIVIGLIVFGVIFAIKTV